MIESGPIEAELFSFHSEENSRECAKTVSDLHPRDRMPKVILEEIQPYEAVSLEELELADVSIML